MARKQKNNGRTINLDMEGVKSGGVLLPEGDYIAEVSSVEAVESENSGKTYLKWELEIAEGKLKGSKVWHNTSLQPQALFNLKGVLISLGVEVPEGKMKLDLDELEGLQMGITIEHEEYDGKPKARIIETFPADGAESDEDDEDGDEAVDLDGMDLDELLAYAKENDIDLSGLSKKAKKDEAKVRAAIQEAEEEDDEEDDEDSSEEDEEGEDEVNLEEMDKEELLSFAKEKEIKLTVKQKKTEASLRKAIAAALEEDDEEDED